MSPIRVLYSFPHRLGAAGIGLTAFQQTSQLAALGLDVTVYCGHATDRPAGARVHQTLSIGRWKLPYRAIGVERAWTLHDRLVARHLRRHPDRYDVVHTWPSGAYHTLRAAKDVGVTSFLHRPNTHTRYAYEIAATVAADLKLPQPEGKSHTFNEARLMREEREFDACDRLLCPSPFVARTFTDRGFPPEKVSPQQYGYDPKRFAAATPRELDGTLHVAFVGNAEPRKGLHVALAAWLKSDAPARGGRFHFAGKLNDPHYAEIVKPMLAHPSVTNHGFVSKPEQIMRSVDVLLLPTFEEGSAKVTFEARACGCVLVVSEAAGAVLMDTVDGLMHGVGDVAALVGHLNRLAGRPEELARLRDASIANVGQLTWHHSAKLLAAEYERWNRRRRFTSEVTQGEESIAAVVA